MSGEKEITQWRSAAFWFADIWALVDLIENQSKSYRPSDRKDFLCDVMEAIKTNLEKENL